MATLDHTPDTIEIPLTKGHTTCVDLIDAVLGSVNWVCAVNQGNCLYAKRSTKIDGRLTSQYLHRVIGERMVGRPLRSGEEIDHIDGNSLNNTRRNLRVCTRTENTRNSRRKSCNTSGYKGVKRSQNGKRWCAFIRVGDGKRLYLGTFDTPEQAHEAYKTAALKHHGEFARF